MKKMQFQSRNSSRISAYGDKLLKESMFCFVLFFLIWRENYPPLIQSSWAVSQFISDVRPAHHMTMLIDVFIQAEITK